MIQTRSQRPFADFAPPLLAGGTALFAFILLGDAPIPRASAMAAVIALIGLTLRPMGAALSVAGALALAFSPSFWAQTGGAPEVPSLIELIAGAALPLVLIALVALPLRVVIPIIAACAVAVAVIEPPLVAAQSLRVTTLLAAWLLFLLTEALILTDIRPDAALLTGRQPYRRDHIPLIALIMLLGILNDPLFALMSPGVLLGIWLTRRALHPVYWFALIGISVYGAAQIVATYIDAGWWIMSADGAAALNRHIPFLIADGFREPSRWLGLFDLIMRQFTPLGALLGLIGLVRLARWHPPIGVVTMLAYGAYAVFGLMYFGADAATLLLPLLMIQVFWMTYAAYAFGQWFQKTFRLSESPLVLWFAPALFVLLPLTLLLRIVGVL
jgi:hypothetical protein